MNLVLKNQEMISQDNEVMGKWRMHNQHKAQARVPYTWQATHTTPNMQPRIGKQVHNWRHRQRNKQFMKLLMNQTNDHWSKAVMSNQNKAYTRPRQWLHTPGKWPIHPTGSPGTSNSKHQVGWPSTQPGETPTYHITIKEQHILHAGILPLLYLPRGFYLRAVDGPKEFSKPCRA